MDESTLLRITPSVLFYLFIISCSSLFYVYLIHAWVVYEEIFLTEKIPPPDWLICGSFSWMLCDEHGGVFENGYWARHRELWDDPGVGFEKGYWTNMERTQIGLFNLLWSVTFTSVSALLQYIHDYKMNYRLFLSHIFFNIINIFYKDGFSKGLWRVSLMQMLTQGRRPRST